MGCWLKSKGPVLVIRDGGTPDDDLVQVGAKPVWFDKLSADAFEHDGEVAVMPLPEPDKKEKDRLTAERKAATKANAKKTEEERLRAHKVAFALQSSTAALPVSGVEG